MWCHCPSQQLGSLPSLTITLPFLPRVCCPVEPVSWFYTFLLSLCSSSLGLSQEAEKLLDHMVLNLLGRLQ